MLFRLCKNESMKTRMSGPDWSHFLKESGGGRMSGGIWNLLTVGAVFTWILHDPLKELGGQLIDWAILRSRKKHKTAHKSGLMRRS